MYFSLRKRYVSTLSYFLLTLVCAISTLFVNNIGFYFLTFEGRIFGVLKKIPQNYITKKYRSE